MFFLRIRTLPYISSLINLISTVFPWNNHLVNTNSGGLPLPLQLGRPIPTLTGSKVSLSQMLENDVTSTYLEWITDPDINRYLEARFQTHSVNSLRRYVNDLHTDHNSVLFKIEMVTTGEHVGNIKLGPINWNHRFSDIGIVIGDKAHHRKGIGTESLTLVRDYAFNVLALNKLNAGAYESNKGSIKLFERGGFEIEGIRKYQYIFEGKHTGLTLMGCVREHSDD